MSIWVRHKNSRAQRTSSWAQLWTFIPAVVADSHPQPNGSRHKCLDTCLNACLNTCPNTMSRHITGMAKEPVITGMAKEPVMTGMAKEPVKTALGLSMAVPLISTMISSIHAKMRLRLESCCARRETRLRPSIASSTTCLKHKPQAPIPPSCWRQPALVAAGDREEESRCFKKANNGKQPKQQFVSRTRTIRTQQRAMLQKCNRICCMLVEEQSGWGTMWQVSQVSQRCGRPPFSCQAATSTRKEIADRIDVGSSLACGGPPRRAIMLWGREATPHRAIMLWGRGATPRRGPSCGSTGWL